MPHALIVDDNQYNIEVLGRLLEAQGVSYSSLTSYQHVLETVQTLNRINVVFLDLEMPFEQDFRKMIKELKAQPRLDGVPIVAYTVHNYEIDQARQAGFDGFLGKPLKIAEFPFQLERIMNGVPVWEF